MSNRQAFVSSFVPAAGAPATSSFSSSFTSPLHASSQPVAASDRRASAAPTMLFGGMTSFSGLFLGTETVALPQHDAKNKAAREKAVADMQQRYEWKWEGIGDAAMCKELPTPEESPTPGWIATVAEILIRVILNKTAGDTDKAIESSVILQVAGIVSGITTKILTGRASAKDFTAVIEEIGDLFTAKESGVGRNLDDYKEMFRTIKLDTVAKLDQFLRDDVFGWYRVAGPNPMRIHKMTAPVTDMFPDITDDLLRGIANFGGDSLSEAAAEGRLYYVDYKELEGIPTGSLEGKKKELYMYAPRCLLAVPKNVTNRMTVLPIAIHCGQGPSFPMFTANSSHTEQATWIAAKYTVQNMDALVHETIYHLGRCHLFEEVMMVSMYRSLADTHPLHKLLKPTFYGTGFINAAAETSLISDGGIIDTITAPTVATSRVISAKAVNDPSFSFNDWMPDKELPSRGVMDEVLNYPYRDDALEHWNILNTFVDKFVNAYYKSDADVRGDYELQNFCMEVTKNGKMHGFGDCDDGTIKTRAYLVRALSMIMFTASVQHAAVNFPQSTLMQFAPAMPLGAAAPAPAARDEYKTVNEWVNKMVFNLETAEVQMQTAELIGVLRYGMVGEYGKALNFAPDEVDEALTQFQEDLGELGAKIQQRNKRERRSGLPVYNYLVPKNVPQSINI